MPTAARKALLKDRIINFIETSGNHTRQWFEIMKDVWPRFKNIHGGFTRSDVDSYLNEVFSTPEQSRSRVNQFVLFFYYNNNNRAKRTEGGIPACVCARFQSREMRAFPQ